MEINFQNTFVVIFFLSLVISCKIEPQPIEFGKDQCRHCVMNIVDKTHAAQFVTKKGKQFKFDAIECMVNVINEEGEEHLAIILVANYAKPGEMINAASATYLITPEIKSPMGANLSAFSSFKKAKEAEELHKGELYNWKELQLRLADK